MSENSRIWRVSRQAAISVLTLFAVAASGAVVHANNSVAGPYASNDMSSLRILAGKMQDDGSRLAGLHISLADGWKTYWRDPGDAGVPPRFDISGSENIAHFDVLWPHPLRFDTYGMMTLGYAHDVVLPLRIVPEDDSKPVNLHLGFDYGVCSDICVPVHAHLGLQIDPQETEAVGQIMPYMENLPITPDAAGVTVLSCHVTGSGGERTFEADVEFDRASAKNWKADEVVASLNLPQGVWSDPATVSENDGGLRITAPLYLENPQSWLSRSDLGLTLISMDRTLDSPTCKLDG